MWPYLIQGLGYGFSAAVQPGPFQAFLLSRTIARGWRRALPAALAPLVSDGPIILLSLLVLSRIPVWFQRGLCLAGGVFLLYLSWTALRTWQSSREEKLDAAPKGRQSVLEAALMNALSPWPYLYWSLVTGPVLLRGWREGPALGIGFLVSFYGTLVLCLAGTILVFGTVRRLGPRFSRTLLGVSALALGGFGCYQLWVGFRGIG